MFNCRPLGENENDIESNSDDSVGSSESLQSTLEESEDERSDSTDRSNNEINSDSDIDKDDSASLIYGVESADPVCVKLNDLIRRGKIEKSRIFYKYLKDVLEVYYDPLHEYDKDVIEFFNSITYLGGRKVACFIRGPMNCKEGRGSHLNTNNEKRMNLGGPSYKTCLKHQAGYTNEPGVWKPLSLGHLSLLQTFNPLPVLKTDELIAYPCCLANDGTALKPAIEFDERLKENVGLTRNLEIDFVKNNPKPTIAFLKDNLVTEAIVSSVTSLENKCSLPCAIEYSTKAGKTAEACKEMFEKQVRILQTCEACQKRSPATKHILGHCSEQCQSFCETCFGMKDVCQECKAKGHVSFHPAIRACSWCLENGEQCVRRVIFVLVADCETGNKGAFMLLRKSIEEGTIDAHLSLLTILPDCPHVGKSLKASFSNWWLKLCNERGNLGLLRTLRNRAGSATMTTMRKLVPRNDHVKNKDRQDPAAVLTLCSEDLTTFLSNVGYVCHTIIPELDKFTENNRLGMYPSPISVAVGKYGWLLFLTWDSKHGSSILYRARLHCPIDKISVVKKTLPSNQVQCVEDVAFLSSQDGPVFVVELEQNSCYLKSSKITSLKRWDELRQQFSLTMTGTLAEIRRQAQDRYLQNKEKEYSTNGYDREQINFHDKAVKDHIQAITLIDRELMYLAVASSKRILSAQLKYDGYGICATNVQEIIQYGEGWESVTSVCVCRNKLFASHAEGISVVCLESRQSHVVYRSKYAKCTVVPFKNGLLFTDQQKATLYQIDEEDNIHIFAGSETEGSLDGLVAECMFKQPMGIAVEFDNVVYMCDPQSNCVKVITPLSQTAKFLSAIGNLYDAFSVHKKGQSVPTRTLQEAESKITECKRFLSELERAVRSEKGCSNTSLNGPQGMVSAVTVKSVDLLDWGVRRLKSLLSSLSFEDTSLLSCMTLDVEHFHSTSHVKHPFLSKKEYCRDFGNTVKETTKRLSSSSFYYFTSEKNSWYPEPEHDIPLSALPSISPLPDVKLSQKEIGQMRDYALTYGAAVRQRTNRQETTMARHGTMPELIYQRQLEISTDKVDVSTGIGRRSSMPTTDVETCNDEIENTADSDTDEIPEYDSSSDEEQIEENAAVLELVRSSTFLVGVSTRFGRQVRINNRFIS